MKCEGFTATATMKDVPLKIGGEYCREDNARGYDPHKVTQINSADFTDEAEAMEIAKAVILKRSLQFQTCEAKTEGNYHIRPRNRITIKYLGKESDGEYLVSSVEHTFNVLDGYFATCHLKRNFCEISNKSGTISEIDKERADNQTAGTESNVISTGSGNQTDEQNNAEDVYKAFIKFYNKLNESLEEAIKIINQWLLEAEKRYNETDLSELIRNANEYINKAIEFIQTKIDEFAQKMFGKGNITLDVKLLEETSSNSKKTIKFVNGQITGEITNALKTEPGTAFFWSGCAKVDPSSGKLLVSGDEVPAEIANKCGGTTLETQIKVNNIEMPKWDFDVPESIKAWEDTSAAYVKQVSGDVRAIVGKNSDLKIFGKMLGYHD